ncbi:hypothetical protein [Adhaeribacter rhizoryzae]|uniref:PorT family protein n=1 Tax=Adhaeribacter rhizoryzae TaxID=2607907 RepID=A0A5M6DJT5_9BACT|nr:hypothetical protein [Adhaeribacter rhizoryzae]KAA5546522.1 hypothetical protein F0145_11590 [Adhaeribacter rhizoryzae]
MSTENMPEDELDDLFRRAASGYHPEFDPDAWRAMEKKLDTQAGATTSATAAKTNWWRWGGLILFILFTGVGVWVGYNQLTQNKALNQNKEVTQTQQTQIAAQIEPQVLNNNPPEESRVTKNIPPKVLTGKTTSKNKVVLTPETGQAASLNNNSEVIARQSRKVALNKPLGNIADKPAKRNQISRFNIARKAILLAGKTEPGNIPAASKTNTPIAPETKEATANSNIVVPATDSVANKIAATKIAETDKLVKPDSSLTATNPTNLTQNQSDSTKANKTRKLLALNRFSISVLAAPDLSTVGFANPGGISTNAGILLGYSLNSRWSLATGIVRARKIYDAKPDDYGNKGYWYNKHQPDDISAVCYVLDIPVNIGYNIWQGNIAVVAVNTGLSSYIMKDEEYTYKYLPYGGGNGYNSYYEVKNKNRHLFSIYNLSGYYGRRLAPGITAGVEPFVKVPLAGVGAGKIKLTSAGIFFSLSYRYPR